MAGSDRAAFPSRQIADPEESNAPVRYCQEGATGSVPTLSRAVWHERGLPHPPHSSRPKKAKRGALTRPVETEICRRGFLSPNGSMPHQSPATGSSNRWPAAAKAAGPVPVFRIDFVPAAKLVFDDGPFAGVHERSKRSRFITLLQAAAKSRTKAGSESLHA